MLIHKMCNGLTDRLTYRFGERAEVVITGEGVLVKEVFNDDVGLIHDNLTSEVTGNVM